MRPKSILIAVLGVCAISSYFAHGLNPYYYDVLIGIGINIILAVGLNLVNGYTGQFSLGHAGFMAVGAYLASALGMGIKFTYLPLLANIHVDSVWLDPLAWSLDSLWLLFTLVANPLLALHNALVAAVASLPVDGSGSFLDVTATAFKFLLILAYGGAAAALSGLVVGVPSLRLKGDYLAIVTLGFNEIIKGIIQNAEPLGAQRGLGGMAQYTNFFWTFAAAALCAYAVLALVHSTYGRGFLAVRDDEIAAEAMGINTTKYKVLAFLIAAFFAGIGGGLYAHYKQFIHPEGFNFLRSVDIVVMVILGGMGNTAGVCLAACILTILPEVLRAVARYEWLPEWLRHVAENRMILYSLLLIILMITRPQGLFGSWGVARRRLKPEPS